MNPQLEFQEYQLDDYQKEVTRTGNMELSKELKTAIFALGIAGEAGEVADLFKKHLGHGHTLVKNKLEKELGDVLWYIAALADMYGIKLSDVAKSNVLKLRARYPDGFSVQRSIDRNTEEEE